uniref:PLOD1-3-like GT domain-containing protein n=1 Tax=Eutreptiella gymnastica TaxID=73025 RepID=A0A7S1N185_9EUGL|mmetsp:Transcript_104389/g.179868  ORF Transcript_104389/g.179868 Transcript_104389/m.179868 type:complete len:387 (+) Transcript_104389:181-1341(+)
MTTLAWLVLTTFWIEPLAGKNGPKWKAKWAMGRDALEHSNCSLQLPAPNCVPSAEDDWRRKLKHLFDCDTWHPRMNKTPNHHHQPHTNHTAFRNSTPSQSQPTMYVWSVASHLEYKETCRFMHSAHHFGVPLNIFGWKTGRNGTGGYGSHVQKLEYGMEVLSSLSNDTLVVYADAGDVLIASTLTELWNKFQTMGADVVANAEACCRSGPLLGTGLPNKKKKKCSTCFQYFPEPRPWSPMRYPNAGLWMGWAWALREIWGEALRLIETCKFQFARGDQEMMVYLWAKFRDAARIRLHLDTQGELLAAYNPIGFCASQVHPLYNCWSSTVGHIVHFPGNLDWAILPKADGLYPQHPRNLTLLLEGMHPLTLFNTTCNRTAAAEHGLV